MCNCGSKRAHQIPQQHLSTRDADEPGGYVNFEYTGNTALTVTGNKTGITYRFHRPGDLQPVDARDMRGMLSIHVLRKRA